ncbi:MAG: LCP family protein [Clostridia bacterium]|nr:LCP family protein [Clostridia bacterium]
MRSKKAQREAKKLAKEEAKALKLQESEGLQKRAGKKSLGKWFKNLKLWKKILVIVLIVLLLTAVIGGSIAFAFFDDIIKQMNKVEEPDEPVLPVDVPELQEDEGFLDYEFSIEPENGFVNILLLGLDTRNMKSFVGSRSDMMMIASINQETYEVKLVSIYRDTYTKIGNTSTYQRANTGIFFGGIDMCLQTLSQMTDINLNKYVVINFQIVVDVVDAIGGVDLDIQQYELKELNKVIRDGCRELGDESMFKEVTETGMQTLNGVQALGYGRMRMDVGGDTKRTERMRIVINAVVDKVKKMKVKEVKDLIYFVTPKIKTNLKTSDVLALGINIAKYNFTTGSGWPTNWCGAEYDDMSLIFPTTLASNIRWLHKYLFGKENYQPSQRAQLISDTIQQHFEEALWQEAGNSYLKGSDGEYIYTRDGERIVVNNGVIQGNWKLNGDGSIYLDEEGFPVPDTGSTEPDNPGTEPENPGTDPENPGTDPENPGTEPENPGTEPENPGTEPENPGTEPENPGTEPENPGTDPEPGNGDGQGETGNQEP